MKSRTCFGLCCFFLLTVVVYDCGSYGVCYPIKLCSLCKWECLYRHIDIPMLANTLFIALTIFSLINSFIIQPLFKLFISIYFSSFYRLDLNLLLGVYRAVIFSVPLAASSHAVQFPMFYRNVNLVKFHLSIVHFISLGSGVLFRHPLHKSPQ